MQLKNMAFEIVVLMSVAALFFGCRKPDICKQAEAKGSAIVGTSPGSGFRLSTIDLVTTSQAFEVLDLYRDAPGEAALNSATQVVITEDASVMTACNAARHTTYIPLPTAAFTIDASNPKAGNDYTLLFRPGEWHRQLKIIVPNAALLDPNKKYALGFKISFVDNNGKISASENQVLAEAGLKNGWEGVYTVNGVMVDLTTPTTTGMYALTWELKPTGANTFAVFDKSRSRQTHNILSGGVLSRYGTFGLNHSMDPGTNKITGVVNPFRHPSANDPATTTFKINYFILQPGATVRTTFDETWVFSGVRQVRSVCL